MEAAILLALQSMRVPGITELMALFSALGNMGFIWIVIGVVCLFFAEKRPTGICIFLTIAVVYIVSEVILEPTIARVRPCDASIGVNAVIGVSHSGYSFPSGHTTISFAIATVICMMSDSHKSKISAVLLAIIIAFSRLYLGVHYPTDVLAGMLIGIVLAVIVVALWRAFLGQLILNLLNLGVGKLAGSDPKRTSVSSGSIHKRSISAGEGSHSKRGGASSGAIGDSSAGSGFDGDHYGGADGGGYGADYSGGYDGSYGGSYSGAGSDGANASYSSAGSYGANYDATPQDLSQEARNYDRRRYSSRLSKTGAHSRKRRSRSKKKGEQ